MAALATRVLKMLEARRGDFLSGQEIADENDVSRTAVWKAISALRASGHVISAVTRQGYRLENSSDRLSEAGIRLALGASFSETEILIYDTLPSTNTTAKELATRGASRDAVVLAEGQSSGRGRRGREFFSPYGSGLYMSVLINLDIPTRDATVLTLLAANSVCRALQKLYAVTPEIKWVNDIFIGKHKVCGILTEALNDVESARMTSAIIGIGINVSTESAQFPKELRDIAASVGNTRGVTRNHLAAEIINGLLSGTKSLHRLEILEEYKRRSRVLGRDIKFTENNTICHARARDIASDGGLIIEERGEMRTIYCSDVSICL